MTRRRAPAAHLARLPAAPDPRRVAIAVARAPVAQKGERLGHDIAWAGAPARAPPAGSDAAAVGRTGRATPSLSTATSTWDLPCHAGTPRDLRVNPARRSPSTPAGDSFYVATDPANHRTVHRFDAAGKLVSAGGRRADEAPNPGAAVRLDPRRRPNDRSVALSGGGSPRTCRPDPLAPRAPGLDQLHDAPDLARDAVAIEQDQPHGEVLALAF